jgi:hypothetical protein
MTTEPIVESGMSFGPYPDGCCFHIERSDAYKTMRHGVKMAEFVLLRPSGMPHPAIWVVEAKSGGPQPTTQPNFSAFIAEIKEKMINAFSLTWALRLGRHRDMRTGLPEPFKNLDLSRAGIRFVLVLNGHKEEWLAPVKDALAGALHSTAKAWDLGPDPVVVLNEKLARDYGLTR